MSSGPGGQAEARTCLVAVDGSEASIDALIWGLRYASDHDMRVEVLTVWPPHGSVFIHEVPGHFCAPRWRARGAQADVIEQALEEVADRPAIATSLENGDAADAIVRASASCELVVLGSNADQTPHRLTARIIDQAPCKVVVAGTQGASRQRLRKNFTV
ncbi:universal stress protein [Nocardioides sp.]|uniref:universal stress protein n=1 Tax=Nocardioides sp. TaxID=35761 RepID=UPI00286E6F28|nr:universal stress protein [Nocardioides sp.]